MKCRLLSTASSCFYTIFEDMVCTISWSAIKANLYSIPYSFPYLFITLWHFFKEKSRLLQDGRGLSSLTPWIEAWDNKMESIINHHQVMKAIFFCYFQYLPWKAQFYKILMEFCMKFWPCCLEEMWIHFENLMWLFHNVLQNTLCNPKKLLT